MTKVRKVMLAAAAAAAATLVLAGAIARVDAQPAPSSGAPADLYLYLNTPAPALGTSFSGSTAPGKVVRIDGFEVGATNQAAIANGSSTREGGKPQLSNLTVTRRMDATSTALFGDVVRGTRLSTVTIAMAHPGRVAGSQIFAELRFSDVYVTAIQWASNADVPSESLTLTYGAVTLDQQPLANAKAGTEPPSVTYNLQTDKTS